MRFRSGVCSSSVVGDVRESGAIKLLKKSTKKCDIIGLLFDGLDRFFI